LDTLVTPANARRKSAKSMILNDNRPNSEMTSNPEAPSWYRPSFRFSNGKGNACYNDAAVNTTVVWCGSYKVKKLRN
jgi:hypothetical protein